MDFRGVEVYEYYYFCRIFQQNHYSVNNQIQSNRSGYFMRKLTVGFIFVALFSFIFSFNSDISHAAEHKIEEIYMHVMVDNEGNAHVTKTRRGHLTEGTENFIVFGNLGNSTIENFKVTENGREFESVSNWDIGASLEEKAYKSGMIHTSEGIELSWGIGEYGQHEYTIEYIITNFIKQLDDSQMLYWQFINPNMNVPPKKVRIEIEASEPLTIKNRELKAFGYSGNIHLIDGKIIIENDAALSGEDYVVALAQFDNGTFAPNDVINRRFEEFHNEAMIGSDYVNTAGVIDEFPEDNGATSSQPDTTPKQNKYDNDDDIDYNFGYMLQEILASVFDLFKSLFSK